MMISTSLWSIALAVAVSNSNAWLSLVSTRTLTQHCSTTQLCFSSSSSSRINLQLQGSRSTPSYEVLVQNETSDTVWIQTVSEYPSDVLEEKGKRFRRASVSVKRAIEQVDAILDLYNANGGGGGGGVGISSDIALNALEGVIVTVFQDSQLLIHNGKLLEQLEDLVWRFGQSQIAPSTKILECLWQMQHSYHGGGRNNNAEKASKQLGRRVRLLTEWYHHHSRGQVAPVPDSYLVQVLDYALENGVTMSFAVWDLYRSLHQNETTVLQRDVYTRLLDLLGASSSEWKLRQCRVLQDMMVVQTQRQRDSATINYRPNTRELQQVLVYAVKSGRVQDAAWLMKLLPETSTQHKLLFLEAVLRSKEAGSALYMQRLVESWSEIGIEGYKLLLKKWSLSRTKGQGKRAHAVFDQIQTRYRESGMDDQWALDARCVAMVVQAYLQEPAANLTQVMNADRFARKCAEQGILHEHSCSLANEEVPRRYPWRVFDRILEAYSTKYYADDKAIQAADRLYQFFLIQHRIGKVSEDPDQYHLGHVLRLWNRKYSGGLGAYKSLEYFNLFEGLRVRGIIQAEPDEFNVRQLLGTLARSDKPGFGDDAARRLNRVLAKETFVSNSYALGHMFWCVVKCYCTERTLKGFVKAMETLDCMEQLHKRNASSIQVTGASYVTVLKSLASLPKTEDDDLFDASNSMSPVTVAEIAREVVTRIENQSQQGNKRVRLARNIYLDGIRCCNIDMYNETCNIYREKLSRL